MWLYMRHFFHLRHVVFSHYEKLRWYFTDTETRRLYFLSINPFDVRYLVNGIFFLIPPLSKHHIKGNW